MNLPFRVVPINTSLRCYKESQAKNHLNGKSFFFTTSLLIPPNHFLKPYLVFAIGEETILVKTR